MKNCTVSMFRIALSHVQSVAVRLILGLGLLFVSMSAFPQSGQKWSTGLNSITATEYLGTSNNASIIFKVNNIEKMRLLPAGFLGIGVVNPLDALHVEGKIRINSFAGNGAGLVKYNSLGQLESLQFTGNNKHVLLGDGTFSTFFDDDWLVTGNNMTTIPTGNVGIGIALPDAKLHVVGDTWIQGLLKVGNSTFTIDGINNTISTTAGNIGFNNNTFNNITAINTTTLNIGSGTLSLNSLMCDSITSQSGTIDFVNNNLNTSGSINASEITTGTITNTSLAGTGTGLATIDSNGTLQKLPFNNTGTSILLSNGTFGEMPAQLWNQSGDNIYTIPDGFVGIGTDAPVEALDVNGNANIRGTLYVQDGVIIGRRVYGERAELDTMRVIKMEIEEELKAAQIKVRELAVEEKIEAKKVSSEEAIKIGKIDEITGIGNTLNIDGQNSKISSTGGSISFGNNNLNTTGAINAGSMNILGQSTFENMSVTNNLNVGNTISTSNIANDSTDLYLQDNINNTIINNSGGMVGIGTDSPVEKLDVNGNANIRGTLYVQDGVIIGRRVYGERAVLDTLHATKMEIAEELKADLIHVRELEVVAKLKTEELDAKIMRAEELMEFGKIDEITGTGNVLNIDGQNSKISSTGGSISFDNNDLNTTGAINAGSMNILGQSTFENMSITNNLSSA